MLAEQLFPGVENIEEVRNRYPARPEGQVVTRFAPSPTGFLHIGGVYTSLVASTFAHQHGGVIFLRIEDTDQARLVERGVSMILDGLHSFGIDFDEGPLDDQGDEKGAYGPYVQSKRKSIYHAFAKWLVEHDKAYPCFMTAQELEEMRKLQMLSKQVPGVYGEFAKRKSRSEDEVLAELQKGTPRVLRLKGHGDPSKKVELQDLVKGTVSMQDSFQDVVLLKGDGIPTYHFAHLVDDYLMGTTHVIRTEERFSSLPLHLQLFNVFGFKPPYYAHPSPILKLDKGNRRKLSKRKDPEANVRYFLDQGYPVAAIKEYLMNIADSKFDDRRNTNPEAPMEQFQLILEDMNNSGALLDMEKLNFVSQQYMGKLSNEEIYEGTLLTPINEELAPVYLSMQKSKEYACGAIGIERGGEKDPKRFVTFMDVYRHLQRFFDESFEALPVVAYPESLPSANIEAFLHDYITRFSLEYSKDERFEQLKLIAKDHGFAPSGADFKAGGYVGKVGDAAMILRIKLFKAAQTPDLYESMKVMGIDRVISRLKSS